MLLPPAGQWPPGDLAGEPSMDIRNALVGFVEHEISKSNSFHVRTTTHQIVITANPQFCTVNLHGIIQLCGGAVHMYTERTSTIVDYADPELFDKIETFIYMLPNFPRTDRALPILTAMESA